jgi:ribosome-binding ATPase YchF (GTP1/OBG family)
MLVGIVGAPNSGKSTFFKAATLTDVEIANYPFTTIKPNQGVGYLTTECPCKKLGVKCSPQNSKCIEGIRHIPVKLIDVAGLVPGAHEGKGMGNQFLNDLTQASGLIHVLDASGKTDPEGKPSESWDPKETIKFLEYEIDEWIKEISSKAFERTKKLAETQKIPIEKLLSQQLSGLGITEDHVKSALKKATPEDHGFASEIRKASKPIIIAANKIDLPSSQENLKSLEKATACSAESELALKEAEKHNLIEYTPGSDTFTLKGEPNEKQKQALNFIKENVLNKFGSTGVQTCLNNLVFKNLDMITVYPVADIGKLSDKSGHVLPDVHLIPKGTTLKELAFRIHTDIGKAFMGGLDISKRKIGAEHQPRDGDVVEILTRK